MDDTAAHITVSREDVMFGNLFISSALKTEPERGFEARSIAAHWIDLSPAKLALKVFTEPEQKSFK